MAKFCTNCGTPVNDGVKFCSNCGAKISEYLPGRGTLLLKRVHEEAHKNYSATVTVDGAPKGEIFDNGELRLVLDAGTHEIGISMRDNHVLTRTVKIVNDEVTTVTVTIDGFVSQTDNSKKQTNEYSTVSKKTVNKSSSKKTKKPIYKKWWFWTFSAIFIIFIITIISATPRKTEVSEPYVASSAVESGLNSASMTSQKAEKSAFMDSCKDVLYEDVARTPKQYEGENVKFNGTVIQVNEGFGNSVTLRVDIGNGNVWYVYYTRGIGEDRILENDYIRCYGVCNGIESYTSIFGAQVTIPSMTMFFYETVASGEDDLTSMYEISYTYFNPYSSDWGNHYDAIVEITNTGDIDLYLGGADFDIEDLDGHLLATDDYISSVPSVIAPGEKGYFYANSESLGDEIDDFENLVLVPKLDIEIAKGEPVSLSVEDCTLYESYGSVGLRGRIVNDTDKEISLMYLTVVYYNEENDAIGITGVNILGIGPNEKTSFECSGIALSSQVTLAAVDHYSVYAVDYYYQ